MSRAGAYRVVITEEAQHDIADIYRYIAATGSVERAEAVLRGLHVTCRGLSRLPGRGNLSKELRDLGTTEFRETHDGPFRVIYRLFDRRVSVYCVFDGRRDVQSLLQRRLLRWGAEPNPRQRIAIVIVIVIECGLQNGTLTIFVAVTLLGSTTMMVPSIYSLIMFGTAGVFMWFVLRRERSSRAESWSLRD
jgi:toxin ParE1/3/4